MKDAVEIVYSNSYTSEYNLLAEFLRSCGIFVYEQKENQMNNKGIEQKICLTDELAHPENEGSNYVASEDLKRIINVLGVEADWEELEQYYREFIKKKIYMDIFAVKYLQGSKELIRGSAEKLFSIIEFLKNKDNKRLKFAYIYLMKLYYDASRYMKEDPDKQYLFDQIMKECSLLEKYPELKKAVYSLKGDIYHDWGFNNVMGIMYYEECVNDYNYIVCGKLADYWKNILKSEEKGNYYILKMLECKEDLYRARVERAFLLEKKGQKNKALDIYQSVLNDLLEKKEDNFLLLDEFYCICQAHKRIGCIIYKDEDNPLYDEAIQHYHTIFEVWNNCKENHFLDLYEKKFRVEIVEVFKRSFDIRGVIASLAKIYSLIGEKEKEKKCNDLFLDKWEELQMIETNL